LSKGVCLKQHGSAYNIVRHISLYTKYVLPLSRVKLKLTKTLLQKLYCRRVLYVNITNGKVPISTRYKENLSLSYAGTEASTFIRYKTFFCCLIYLTTNLEAKCWCTEHLIHHWK